MSTVANSSGRCASTDRAAGDSGTSLALLAVLALIAGILGYAYIHRARDGRRHGH